MMLWKSLKTGYAPQIEGRTDSETRGTVAKNLKTVSNNETLNNMFVCIHERHTSPTEEMEYSDITYEDIRNMCHAATPKMSRMVGESAQLSAQRVMSDFTALHNLITRHPGTVIEEDINRLCQDHYQYISYALEIGALDTPTRNNQEARYCKFVHMSSYLLDEATRQGPSILKGGTAHRVIKYYQTQVPDSEETTMEILDAALERTLFGKEEQKDSTSDQTEDVKSTQKFLKAVQQEQDLSEVESVCVECLQWNGKATSSRIQDVSWAWIQNAAESEDGTEEQTEKTVSTLFNVIKKFTEKNTHEAVNQDIQRMRKKATALVEGDQRHFMILGDPKLGQRILEQSYSIGRHPELCMRAKIKEINE